MTEHASTNIQLLGEAERAWLGIVRLSCMSYEHNRADFLDRAMHQAETLYGPDTGPEIMSRILALIRAMRLERRGGFGYLSPFCETCRRKVTADEWELIALMRIGCDSSGSDVDAAAAEFARRTHAPVLAGAAARFGCAFATTRIASRTSPATRAVLH
ncbi:MAG: hypothetical protein AB7S70_02210 [Hyphomicrobium sp.]|uniref:hypothetical protein n=1 Tax=Hyphomicrobium sp. TaxID=82 RepID=UPI003D0E31A5